MKQFKIFIILLLCCLPIKIAIAEGDGHKQPSSTNTIILSKNTSASKRPHAPARDFIVCQYGVGYLEFIFPNDINSLTIQVYNNDSWTGFVTVEEPVIETPIFEGEYTIQCTTNDGSIFNGIIDF